MSEIHFHSVGPIGSGILTPEMVVELQATMRPSRCPWFWGSHGCDLAYEHEGTHECLDEDGDVCCQSGEVDRHGYEASGFKWDLYGGWDDE